MNEMTNRRSKKDESNKKAQQDRRGTHATLVKRAILRLKALPDVLCRCRVKVKHQPNLVCVPLHCDVVRRSLFDVYSVRWEWPRAGREC
jgi:hypothetical protein